MDSIESGEEQEMSHREILGEIAREASRFILKETRHPAHIAISGGLTAFNLLAGYLEIKSGTKLGDSDMVAVMGTTVVALSYNATVAAAYLRGSDVDEEAAAPAPVASIEAGTGSEEKDILLEEAARRRAWMDGEDSIV